ncbi:MAG: histidinol-phosphate transaminase [Deltaproteobacteria bacterium]|nr:histidinol-phosphate transaminase [Deltaproteobacteria bacterium]
MSDLRHLVCRRLAPLTAYTPKAPAPIKLDANESPWPLPEEARKVLAAALACLDLHRYPDPRATRLRALLAERHGGAADDYVVGVGSDEVICLLMQALSEPRQGLHAATVLFPEPSFVMYRHNGTVSGMRPVAVPLGPDFSLDASAMAAAVLECRPNLIFLASPNNPTGNAFADEAINEVIDAAPDALVVIDEAYAPFAGRSLGALVDDRPNVALMGTLSKVGLAGARVGFCRLPPSLAAHVDKARQPYNLSSLSLCAAELALTDLSAVLEGQVAAIVEERGRLESALREYAELRPLPSAANFILTEVEGRNAAARVAVALRKADIAVRAFPAPGPLAKHLRITVGTPDQNDALLAALPAALSTAADG